MPSCLPVESNVSQLNSLPRSQHLRDIFSPCYLSYLMTETLSLLEFPISSISRREHARSVQRKRNSRDLIPLVFPKPHRSSIYLTKSLALSPAVDRCSITSSMRFLFSQRQSLRLKSGKVFSSRWFVSTLDSFRTDCLDWNCLILYFQLPPYEAISRFRCFLLPQLEDLLSQFESVSQNFGVWFVLCHSLNVEVAEPSLFGTTNSCSILSVYLRIGGQQSLLFSQSAWLMSSYQLPLPLFQKAILPLVYSHSRLVVPFYYSRTVIKVTVIQVIETTKLAPFPSPNLLLHHHTHLPPTSPSSALSNVQKVIRVLFDLANLESARLPKLPPLLVGFAMGSTLLKMYLLETVILIQPFYHSAIIETDLLALMALEACLSRGELFRNC